MPVIEITSKADFMDKILGSEEPVILDCYAEWCGPCKVIAPKIEEWSNVYSKVKFYKVDVDKLDDVAQELGVRAMPTFVLFKGGQKVTEVVGARLPAIEQGIKSLLEE
ncbi:Thioredoxin [Penicillium bovifimosum]|uniref:Thioredoxin n=1 Tax=Penicillium bovifimosum TaxID=126998 RepID=A0A9W9GY17_9EURO|nr:Thioredoxin [Penicillium bovifimosum]KAJ5131426.1 Thioredoxin [Penicillium bovifimosum]